MEMKQEVCSPCHYFTTLEFGTAISPYTSSSIRSMYPSSRDRQMKGSLPSRPYR